MQIIKEFQEFAVKGNAVDMAVGLVIGAAFGNVVNSIVNDIIMPPIGFMIGGMDFSALALVLKPAVGTSPEVSIKYGSFINKLINFLIVAFSMFMVVKGMNNLREMSERLSKKKVVPPEGK